ncbi:MAG: hypothetical protein J6K36_00780 [Bacilli bacterium]|nr:hypothetical protein [Bacilli bacterium]
MKYISLLNPITIKYLIDNPNTKYFIINTLKLILNDEDFELLNYFTHEEENVRSYTFFKNKSKIVLMDYNINENKDQFNDDLDILNFIKETSKEEVHLVYFTTEKGSNIYDENIHIIRKNNKNSPYLKLILAENYKEQKQTEFNDIIDYLYSLDNQFLKRYLKERELLYNYK